MGEESPVPAEKKVHRSKGVVERNLPRWFRKPGFKPWDDFLAFFRRNGAALDAALAGFFQDLDQKGDDAAPGALGKLIKHYNKSRRFQKQEIAPPWFFVEGAPGTLPADDAWTVELAVNLDHDRSQRAPSKSGREKAQPKEGAAPSPGEAKPGEAKPAGEEAAPPPAPASTGVVQPPMADRQWFEALRRLPTAIQVLVDGRGKNASELNDRRRRALDLSQLDRQGGLSKLGAEMRKDLLLWLLEKKRDVKELEAEVKRRLAGIDEWIAKNAAAAKAKVKELDDHAKAELEKRLRSVYPKEQDEPALLRLARSALDASRPKRRESWAKKVLDDFNNSRGSSADRVRDPWLVDGLIRWLSSRKDDDTPTDGEIYDQIQHLGGPNMAAKKRRPEGPREPKRPEKKPKNIDDDEPPPPPKKGPKATAKQAPAPAAEAAAPAAPPEAPPPPPPEAPSPPA